MSRMRTLSILLLSLGFAGRFPWRPATRWRTATCCAGRSFIRNNCAACHGVNLEGQPDWQVAGPDGGLSRAAP